MATLKSGYLQKLSGFFKRDWKQRYFVLYEDGAFVYYERAGDQHSDGRVNMKYNCHRIDYGYEVEQDTQLKASGRVNCLLSVNTTEKTLFLLADTEQDARDWVQKLNQVRQNTMPMGNYGAPVHGMNQPGMPYPGQPGMPYPNSQPGMPYPNSQSGMPYPNNQPQMPYPYNQPQMPYPNNQPGMPMPYPVGTAYPRQPAPYNQPMGTAPYQAPAYPQYPNRPQYYPAQPPPAGGYGYPVYQQQQVHQSKGTGLSSRRGLMAGAAGGALAGGLLGFGMGRAVGGFGDSFDSCDGDFGCDFD